MVESKRLDLRRLAGITCSIIAAFFVALGAVFYKLTEDSVGVQVWFLRFVFMYFLNIPYLSFKSIKQELPVISSNSMSYLVAFGFFSIASSLTLYLSLDELSAGDSFAICNSNFVITLVFSYIFLKEKHHPVVIILAIASMVGVFLVARPTFLFGNDDGINVDPNQNRALGVALAVSTAFFSSAKFISGRKLKDNVHLSQMMTSVCIQALIAFPIYALITNQGWYIPCTYDWGLLIASALSTLLSNSILALALQLERAGPVSMVYTSLIAFSFILESIMLKTVPRVTSVIGALLVLLGSIGTIFVQFQFPAE
ncbi:solute carrier family 35 member G1-like [Ciona intestinalis]